MSAVKLSFSSLELPRTNSNPDQNNDILKVDDDPTGDVMSEDYAVFFAILVFLGAFGHALFKAGLSKRKNVAFSLLSPFISFTLGNWVN